MNSYVPRDVDAINILRRGDLKKKKKHTPGADAILWCFKLTSSGWLASTTPTTRKFMCLSVSALKDSQPPH